jgi:DNA ligase-1
MTVNIRGVQIAGLPAVQVRNLFRKVGSEFNKTWIQAGTCEDFAALRFPLYASLKLDGVRALITKVGVLSRSLKPIPNNAVQKLFTSPDLDGLDGEFIFGAVTAHDVCRQTVSAVMSPDKPASGLVYHVFDFVTDGPFTERYAIARQKVERFSKKYPITLVEQRLIHSLAELEAMEEKALSDGHEGIMVRRPAGLYKHGRATEKSQDLLNIKRFEDDEAIVVGVTELMHNDNAAFTNEIGRTARSTAQDGLVGAGTLGALLLRNQEGVEFSVGSGFDADERKELWRDRKVLMGRLVKYRYFPSGSKDKPRFPTWIGFRDVRDRAA